MLRRTFFTLLMILAVLSASRSSQAFDTDVDVDNNVLEIETDENHDIVVVRINSDDPEEIEILILQFKDPVDLFEFEDEEDAIASADNFRDEYRRLSKINKIDIKTYEGNDSIIIDLALSIPCKIVAGLGDDFVMSGSGDDEIWGDDENVMTGFNGGEDTIHGMLGEDEIYGGPNDDTLIGGLHDDVLAGGDGVDTLRGNSGEDELYGGNQKDYLYGGDDADDLFGGSGDDEMDGGYGDDNMYGGAHNDIMLGGPGDDVMHGDNGDDDLFGEDGQDDLFGGNHNDYLDGSFDGELDILEGGHGADEFVDRYFETITNTTYSEYVYFVPRIIFDGFRVRVVYERRVIRFPVVTTVQNNLEVELLNDFSAADGDTRSPVEIE